MELIQTQVIFSITLNLYILDVLYTALALA